MDRLKFATITALVFFSFGTLILISQICFRNEFAITIFGLYYVLFSIVINSLIVLVMLFSFLVEEKAIKTLKSIGILLVNIPIALLYYILVIDYII